MNLPQLRFDRFNGEWEEKVINEVASMKGGYAFPSNRFKNTESNYQVIKMGNLYNNELNLNRSPSYIDDISIREKEFLLKQGDIIITLTGTVNKTDFGYSHMITNEQKKLLNQRLALIKSNVNSDSFFMLNIIQHKRFLLQFFKSSTGGTGNQANVSTKNIEQFTILIPSLAEQKKISSFFLLINKKIIKQQEKIEKLEELKKGMMQKIFSQEIRFKKEDGGEFPEWESYLLGEVSDVRDGTHDSPKYISKGYPLITSKNLKRNGKISWEDISYVSEFDYEQINKRSNVEIGDILFGMIGTIGNPVMVENSNFAIKNVALIKEKQNLLNKFLIHYLKSQNIDKQFHLEQTGGTQKFIALGIIRSLKINLPNVEEQNKIAGYLGELDKKINIEIEKLKVLQEQKKGYMQAMFI